jgi:formylglycine-generating enzyme required for sulfatase activity
VEVDWDDARLYCQRIGRRLPTEAEFEYLLRGSDSLPPWKDTPASACRVANLADSALTRSEAGLQAGIDSAIGPDEDGDYADWKAILSRRSEVFPCHDGFPGVAPGGRFPADRRGLLDLWGNVAEWTADRYGSYEDLPEHNPTGAERGDERVVRGGSWKQGPTRVTPWNRTPNDETYSASDLGFRCAAD